MCAEYVSKFSALHPFVVAVFTLSKDELKGLHQNCIDRDYYHTFYLTTEILSILSRIGQRRIYQLQNNLVSILVLIDSNDKDIAIYFQKTIAPELLSGLSFNLVRAEVH